MMAAGVREDVNLAAGPLDREGGFELIFDFQRAVFAGTRAATVVRAVNALSVELAASEVLVGPSKDTFLELVLESTEDGHLSEYEVLLSALGPVFGDQSIARLDDEQIRRASATTGVQEGRVRQLKRAAAWAESSETLSPAVFYALLHAGLPGKLKSLLRPESRRS